jgi:two-component sensor histidine kinase
MGPSGPAGLHAVLPIEPTSPRRARRLLADWLSAYPCGCGAVDGLIYAVSEAVTNSIEHAVPADGVVTVEATATCTDAGELARLVATVTDTGRWRPAPADPGDRGRGLAMMEAFVERAHVDTGDSGTRVHITSHLC